MLGGASMPNMSRFVLYYSIKRWRNFPQLLAIHNPTQLQKGNDDDDSFLPLVDLIEGRPRHEDKILAYRIYSALSSSMTEASSWRCLDTQNKCRLSGDLIFLFRQTGPTDCHIQDWRNVFSSFEWVFRTGLNVVCYNPTWIEFTVQENENRRKEVFVFLSWWRGRWYSFYGVC